ncbi:MAG: hypothetical protein ACFB0A_07880 [Croceivirga sp.]|mgnify:CR=1 FL=1
MYKSLLLLFIGILLISCGSDDGPPPPQLNVAPTVPELVFPSNNLLCIDNSISFSWKPSFDANEDRISYQFELSEENRFVETFINLPVEDAVSLGTVLEKGKAYYWRVKALDDKGGESQFSPTFSFFTEAEGLENHAPFAPELILPQLGATISNGIRNLQWDAGDTDGDPLSYDVYLDTENPPTVQIVENHDSILFETDLAEATTYYWRVVVKDDKGGEALGSVWSFTTE